MGGGLVQLVAFGAENIYLTGSPQITFFKQVYRRHTNFSTESIQQVTSGNAGPGTNISITISRNGDLLKNVYINYSPREIFIIPQGTSFDAYDKVVLCSDLGHALFDTIDLEIGGQIIDRHYGKWLTIWRDLTEKNMLGYQAPVNYAGGAQLNRNGYSTLYQNLSYTGAGGVVENTAFAYGLPGYYYYLEFAPLVATVPMQFWFCKNPGLALPLISLQYHEVKLNINFTKKQKLIYGIYPDGSIDSNFDLVDSDYSSVQVFGEYVFLDSSERKQFANSNHEYLIEQVQYVRSSGNTIDLNFSHPVKELILTGCNEITNDLYIESDSIFKVQSPATPYPIFPADLSPFYGIIRENISMKLVFNGTDRFSTRHLSYFTREQLFQHHSSSGLCTMYPDSIALYSFALRPEEIQPSGTCNFSRLNTARIVLGSLTDRIYDFSNTQIDIYAVNYNVFRISSGMGSIAYSN